MIARTTLQVNWCRQPWLCEYSTYRPLNNLEIYSHIINVKQGCVFTRKQNSANSQEYIYTVNQKKTWQFIFEYNFR